LRTIGLLLKVVDQPVALPETATKERYLAAAKQLRAQNFARALEGFIDVLQTDREYDTDGARRACIAIFKLLGEEHEITKEYRTPFSRALYV